MLLLAFNTVNLQAQTFDQQHSVFTKLLKQHVDADSRVDYQALQDDPEDLRGYLEQLAGVSSEQFDQWSDAQQIAYWVNAYNAFTLQAIVDHYPIESSGFGGLFSPSNSIKQIDGVWDELEWDAARGEITLDAIEHEVLRKEFTEPRIHFAIVCASIGCPDLRTSAYTAEQLDEQLAEQTQAFLSNSNKGLSVADGKVKVSKIFDWFAEDFAVEENDTSLFAGFNDAQAGVLRFIVSQLPEGERRSTMLEQDFRLGYLDYDWELNDQ